LPRHSISDSHSETAVSLFAGIKGSEDYPFSGQLDFVSSSLDPNTGTILLRAVFSNPKSASGVPKLLPGMFERLRIPVDVRENALLVPERALGVDQNGRCLLVVNSQDVVDQRPVKVGAGVGDVIVFGAGQYSMRVWLDYEMLKSYTSIRTTSSPSSSSRTTPNAAVHFTRTLKAVALACPDLIDTAD
jgi:hypothetical protein